MDITKKIEEHIGIDEKRSDPSHDVYQELQDMIGDIESDIDNASLKLQRTLGDLMNSTKIDDANKIMELKRLIGLFAPIAKATAKMWKKL